MKAQSDVEIENLKSRLNIASTEHEVTFSELHKLRVEVIEQLYEKLEKTDRSFYSLIKRFQAVGEESIKDKFELFVKLYGEYHSYYQVKRIYFNTETCELIDSLNRLLFVSHVDLTTYPVDPEDLSYVHQPGLIKDRSEHWNKVSDSYEQNISKIKHELEERFREILRV